MPIRFHLDENVGEGLAAGLRRRGIDSRLVGRVTSPDPKTLANWRSLHLLDGSS